MEQYPSKLEIAVRDEYSILDDREKKSRKYLFEEVLNQRDQVKIYQFLLNEADNFILFSRFFMKFLKLKQG